MVLVLRDFKECLKSCTTLSMEVSHSKLPPGCLVTIGRVEVFLISHAIS